MLLSPPAILAKNLDLWDRSENPIQAQPLVSVSSFDISASSEPKDRSVNDDVESFVRRRARRLLDGSGGKNWQPSRDNGSALHVSFSLKYGKTTTLNGSISASFDGPFGNISMTQSDNVTVDRDLRDRVDFMFDRLMDKVDQDLTTRLNRLAWQAEWRPFSGLCRAKS